MRIVRPEKIHFMQQEVYVTLSPSFAQLRWLQTTPPGTNSLHPNRRLSEAFRDYWSWLAEHRRACRA